MNLDRGLHKKWEKLSCFLTPLVITSEIEILKKYVWNPSLHKIFCARPYTGPVKIKTVRQAPYSKGTHSLVGETHKAASTGASKNHRN